MGFPDSEYIRDQKGIKLKTLEQTILEASNPHYGIMGEKTKAIASAVREWMKEQNEGLRKAIYNVLVDELPADQNSLDDCSEYTNAILSVIPPRMVYDPRPLQAEIDGWKTAARIVELEDQLKQEIWQHAACLTIAETGEKWGKNVQPSAAMMAVYDLKQDYQRLDLEFRTLKNAHKRLADECGNYHKGDRSSSKFTEIKALLDKLRPIRKEQESRIIHARTYIMDYDYEGAISTLSDFLEEMQKAKAIHAEIDSIIEQSQISQMEEQRKEFDNDAPFPDETIEALKEFTKRSSEKCRELEAEVARLHTNCTQISKKAENVDHKAKLYDELRKQFPFLPGEEFYVIVGGKICRRVVYSVSEYAVPDQYQVIRAYKQCYSTAEECRAAIKVEE